MGVFRLGKKLTLTKVKARKLFQDQAKTYVRGLADPENLMKAAQISTEYEVCQESFETWAVTILFAKKFTIYAHTLQSSPPCFSIQLSMRHCHDAMQCWKACSGMALSSLVKASLMASTSMNLIPLMMPLSCGKRKNHMGLNPNCKGAGQALRRFFGQKTANKQGQVRWHIVMEQPCGCDRWGTHMAVTELLKMLFSN